MLSKIFNVADRLYFHSLSLRCQFSLLASGTDMKDGLQDVQTFIRSANLFSETVGSERNAAALRFTIEAFFIDVKDDKTCPRNWGAFMHGIEKAVPMEMKAAKLAGDEQAEATISRIAMAGSRLARSYHSCPDAVRKGIDIIGSPIYIRSLVGNMMAPYDQFEIDGKRFWALIEDGEAALAGELELDFAEIEVQQAAKPEDLRHG